MNELFLYQDILSIRKLTKFLKLRLCITFHIVLLDWEMSATNKNYKSVATTGATSSSSEVSENRKLEVHSERGIFTILEPSLKSL